MLTRNKASLRLEQRPLHELHAHDRLLLLLKTQGQTSTAALARQLGITTEAARQQLLRLREEGLVESNSEVHGRGRPVQLWKLAPAANRRFPDAHGELSAQLIQAILKTLGEPALEQVLGARTEELLARYRAVLQDTPSLKERIERLVVLRNAEGYMAESRRQKAGFLLIQNHCPICSASGVCSKLCRSEVELFRKLLGPQVEVKREEYIGTGARRCVYRVQISSPSDKE